MYGIRDKTGRMLCWSCGHMTLMANWKAYKPVMIESATEIDQLHQDAMYTYANYSLVVFEFTPEEEQEIMLKTIAGY